MNKPSKLAVIEAVAVTAAGFALWISIARGIRRNLHALDRDLVFAPGFSLCVVAAMAMAAVFMVRGIAAVETLPASSRTFTRIEAPLTVAVCAVWISIAWRWQILGDMSPANPLTDGDGLPVVIRWIDSGLLFGALSAVILAILVLAFVRALRNRGADNWESQ